MISATPEEQRTLLDLQHVDTTIRQLQHRRGNLPEQQALDQNADTLARVRGEHADARERLDQLNRAQMRLESEIATVDARRKSEEGRMYSGLITSEKEVQALRNEISSLKQRKGELEDSLLDVMQELEDVESLVATLDERQEELAGNVAGLEQARDEASRDLDAELAERQQERTQLAAGLPVEVGEYYEELRDRKDGIAVAELVGRTCQGCRLELTAVEFEDAHERARKGLARCEQCGRILVPTG